MAEEYTAEDIAKFSDDQIDEFNGEKYQRKKFIITGNSGLYGSYKADIVVSDAYFDRSANQLIRSDQIDKLLYENTEKQDKSKWVLREEPIKWPACQFLAFLLHIAKTKANISLDTIKGSIPKLKNATIQRNGDQIQITKSDSTAGGYFLWDKDSIAIATSDGKKDRSNCIKMIQMIHQTNKEIFAGFRFAFDLSSDSNKGKQAMDKKNENVNDIVKIVEEAIPKNKQVIFTGAPGTGKTYTVRKFVKEHTQDESQYKFVQFHPSYDYSDFVEGLRPVVTKDSPDPTFVRLDGTFKQFCRSIVEKELETFCSGFRDLSAPEKRAKLKEYYDDNAVKKGTSQGEETVYYFLIDEINRADLSKVFGELMFGLEESYRGIENRFDTQYKNLKTYQVDPDTGIASPMAFDCFADGFFIPHNLHLIGTMNDIDRSVESFDFALRRRFRWIDVKANKIMESSLKAMGVPDPEDIARRASNMNCCLSESDFGLGEAYHIGPAYFKSMSAGEKLKEDLKEVFSHRIEPLLREYTRGQDAQDVEELIQKCKDTLLENKTQGGE